MKQDKHYFEKMGYAALMRAAYGVAEEAKRNDDLVPFEKEGRLVWGIPRITSEMVAEAENAKPEPTVS